MQLPGFASPVSDKHFPNWRKIFLQLAIRLHLHYNGKWLSYVETCHWRVSMVLVSRYSRVLAGFDPQSHTDNLTQHVASLQPRQVEMPDHVWQETGGEYVPHFDMSFFYAFNRLNKRRKEPFRTNPSKNIFKKSWRNACQFQK